MSYEYAGTVAEALARVEGGSYPNAATEQKVRAEVGRLVNNDIRSTEANLIAQAKELVAHRDSIQARVNEVEAELQVLAREVRTRPDDDIEDLIERWQLLDRKAQAAMQLAYGLPERMAGLDTKLADPLAALQALQEKYAGIRRPGRYGI